MVDSGLKDGLHQALGTAFSDQPTFTLLNFLRNVRRMVVLLSELSLSGLLVRTSPLLIPHLEVRVCLVCACACLFTF